MRCVAFVLACVLVGQFARAEEPRIEVSGGYAYLWDQDKDLLLKRSHNGGYIDGDFAWEVGHDRFPMLLGLGVSASGFYRSHDELLGESATLRREETFQSGVGLFSAEGRFAVPFGAQEGERGWFVMPRIGAGLIVDDYSIDTRERNGAFHIERTRDHEGAAFGVRPTLEIGYRYDWGSVGFQTSYLAGWGDFGQLGSLAQEFRAGVFVRFRI